MSEAANSSKSFDLFGRDCDVDKFKQNRSVDFSSSTTNPTSRQTSIDTDDCHSADIFQHKPGSMNPHTEEVSQNRGVFEASDERSVHSDVKVSLKINSENVAADPQSTADTSFGTICRTDDKNGNFFDFSPAPSVSSLTSSAEKREATYPFPNIEESLIPDDDLLDETFEIQGRSKKDCNDSYHPESSGSCQQIQKKQKDSLVVMDMNGAQQFQGTDHCDSGDLNRRLLTMQNMMEEQKEQLKNLTSLVKGLSAKIESFQGPLPNHRNSDGLQSSKVFVPNGSADGDNNSSGRGRCSQLNRGRMVPPPQPRGFGRETEYRGNVVKSRSTSEEDRRREQFFQEEKRRQEERLQLEKERALEEQRRKEEEEKQRAEEERIRLEEEARRREELEAKRKNIMSCLISSEIKSSLFNDDSPSKKASLFED